jgi:hypothetical protein
MNLHWQPIAERCSLDSFRYDFVLRLEENFTASVRGLFSRLGLDPAHFPEHHYNAHVPSPGYPKTAEEISESVHCEECDDKKELVKTLSQLYARDLELYTESSRPRGRRRRRTQAVVS